MDFEPSRKEEKTVKSHAPKSEPGKSRIMAKLQALQGLEAQRALLKPKSSIEEDIGLSADTALPYKDEMEQAFGTDLSDVKALVSKDATEALNAEAFAVGSEVVFEQPTPPKGDRGTRGCAFGSAK